MQKAELLIKKSFETSCSLQSVLHPFLTLTSNTAKPKGWLRSSTEEIRTFLLLPLKSMQDSECNLESTQ